MARKRVSHKTSTPSKTGGGKKQKQPTQKPGQQRVAVMGPSGKIRFEWRPW